MGAYVGSTVEPSSHESQSIEHLRRTNALRGYALEPRKYGIFATDPRFREHLQEKLNAAIERLPDDLAFARKTLIPELFAYARGNSEFESLSALWSGLQARREMKVEQFDMYVPFRIDGLNRDRRVVYSRAHFGDGAPLSEDEVPVCGSQLQTPDGTVYVVRWNGKAHVVPRPPQVTLLDYSNTSGSVLIQPRMHPRVPVMPDREFGFIHDPNVAAAHTLDDTILRLVDRRVMSQEPRRFT